MNKSWKGFKRPVLAALLFATLGLLAGCTTINVTTTGNVVVDAHKEIAVVDPNATVGLPVL